MLRIKPVAAKPRGDAQAALHLMFLFAFQDVTWIAVPPHIPGPDALPQTSTAVPGGIHGLAPQREYLPFAVETPRQYGACTYVQPRAIGAGPAATAFAFFLAAASAPVTATAPQSANVKVSQCLAAT